MGLDDPGHVHGQPVSLQLVARRLEEEKLLSMAEIVGGLL
jgi:Asp-tRNA(Asn)/Glu-tRNA(Gln) amidotransferase A subunit family amidase